MLCGYVHCQFLTELTSASLKHQRVISMVADVPAITFVSVYVAEKNYVAKYIMRTIQDIGINTVEYLV